MFSVLIWQNFVHYVWLLVVVLMHTFFPIQNIKQGPHFKLSLAKNNRNKFGKLYPPPLSLNSMMQAMATFNK